MVQNIRTKNPFFQSVNVAGQTRRVVNLRGGEEVETLIETLGSFHVKSSGDFHGPPPILLKFGTLVGIV